MRHDLVIRRNKGIGGLIAAGTEEKGKQLCTETEIRATAENEKKLELIRAKADEMINNNKNSASIDSKAVTDAASLHLREAVRYIIGGVMKECQ